MSTIHGVDDPRAIVAGDSAVWVTDYRSATVKRISPATNRIVADLKVGEVPEALALGDGSLWVANGAGSIVSRVNVRTNKVIATFTVGRGLKNTLEPGWEQTVATGYGLVWMVVHDDKKLVSIDPRTNKPIAALTFPIPSGETFIEPQQVAVGDGSVWVYAGPHFVFRIDPKSMM